MSEKKIKDEDLEKINGGIDLTSVKPDMVTKSNDQNAKKVTPTLDKANHEFNYGGNNGE